MTSERQVTILDLGVLRIEVSLLVTPRRELRYRWAMDGLQRAMSRADDGGLQEPMRYLHRIHQLGGKMHFRWSWAAVAHPRSTWNLVVLWLHFQLNPSGQGCSCWGRRRSFGVE